MPQVYDKRVNVKTKPDWLKTKLQFHSDAAGDGACAMGGSAYRAVAKIVEKHGVHTICESGRCPNKIECWSRRTATFMVLGDVCTRACKFCATVTGKPLPPDTSEPQRVARSVALMGLRHAVITSVTRDDLPDGGAAHWVAVGRALRQFCPDTTIEVLIPDFGGDRSLLDTVLTAGFDIVGHNIETVARLTPSVRSRARYEVSLGVLRHIASSWRAGSPEAGSAAGFGTTSTERQGGAAGAVGTVLRANDLSSERGLCDARRENRDRAYYGVCDGAILEVAEAESPLRVNDLSSERRACRADRRREGEDSTYGTASTERQGGAAGSLLSRQIAKSGLMVGLGETPDEVLGALDDLREAGVSIVTIGQYLRPTLAHLPVAEYVTPEMFEFYRQEALARGFSHVASGPLVRSSYMAEKALAGLARTADTERAAALERTADTERTAV